VVLLWNTLINQPGEGFMKFSSAIAAFLTAVFLIGCAAYGSGQMPAKVSDGMLTDSAGMTLYTFDRDTAGKSACNGPCEKNWPPLMAGESAKPSGNYSVITRDDGKKQWAYNGKPLYTWVKDQKPGDKTGDGVNNVWHIAKP
jgi:predicted lipoprotein with Yx(FWY)xxD motif